MDEKTIQKMNTAISVVFISAALILFMVALQHRQASVANPGGASTAPKTSDTQDYDDLAGMQQAALGKDFASWTPEGKLDAEKTLTASLVVKGQIAKAYLAVKASLDGKPLTKYESVYLKLNDVGGHLFRPQSLKTPDTGDTSLLYELNDVPVLPSVPYDEARVPEKADLAATLQDGKTVRLTAFISSLRPALLEDVTIAYVCADNSDCSLTIK